jgi:hypothetical protein
MVDDYRGWEKVSISRFLHVSRPTVDAWIRRSETEHLAGLVDQSRAPKATVRKIWLPLMVQVYHLQKVHPDAGRSGSGACWPGRMCRSGRLGA